MFLASSLFRSSQRGLFEGVPGLYYSENFLDSNAVKSIRTKSIGLFKALLDPKASSSPVSSQTALSKYHNLKSDEYFRFLYLDDEENGKVRGQHFDTYGEKKHTLTYFTGNQNIPKFVNELVIPKLLELPDLKKEHSPQDLNWNFTFNTYATSGDSSEKLPGFDFHKDIEFNGDATAIYSIGIPSIFEIRHPDRKNETTSIPLTENSLVMISREARWDFEHRIVPVQVLDPSFLMEKNGEKVRRMSLVLGFRKLPKP